MENIKVEFIDKTALLTIDRPKALNALSSETINEIKDFVESINKDSDIYSCIITGNGRKAFIAGADISQMYDMNKDDISEYCKNANDLFRLIQESPVIFIAAVNGYALGGGNELAMACDIRIASSEAVFGQPEISLGIIPGFGGTQRLPALIGISNAMNLILSGDKFGTEKALSMGLISSISEPDSLMKDALEIAARISGKSRRAVVNTKKAVYNGFYKNAYSGISIETELISECFETDERRTLMGQMLGK